MTSGRSSASLRELPGKKISKATAVAAYEKEVRETTKVFQRSHMTEATLEEHDKYTIWISKWADAWPVMP